MDLQEKKKKPAGHQVQSYKQQGVSATKLKQMKDAYKNRDCNSENFMMKTLISNLDFSQHPIKFDIIE